jgi:hypothetical protein
MPQNCFCPKGIALCSSCHMKRTTEIELAAFLADDSKYAWDVSIMSEPENEEMKSQIRWLHASDWTWKREYDKLLLKQREHQQLQRQFRLQQLLLRQQKETEQRQLEQQEQQEQQRLEDKRKQQERTKREILLQKEHYAELEFRRQLASTVQDLRLLWKLNANADEQPRQPHVAQRLQRPPGPSCPLRFLRPAPATGTMPVL